MGALDPYAQEIARMAGFRGDEPGFQEALAYAERVLTARYGPLAERVEEYTYTPSDPVRFVPLPGGEVVEAPPGRLVSPRMYALDQEATPGEPLTFRLRVDLDPGHNPLVLRAAAELAQRYMVVADPTATQRQTITPAMRELEALFGGVAWSVR